MGEDDAKQKNAVPRFPRLRVQSSCLVSVVPPRNRALASVQRVTRLVTPRD